jgi:hypothetical protein
MKTLWKALCAAAMVGMTMFSAHAEEKTITIGTMSWEDLTPITGITKKVLEDSGYTVKVVPFLRMGHRLRRVDQGRHPDAGLADRLCGTGLLGQEQEEAREDFSGLSRPLPGNRRAEIRAINSIESLTPMPTSSAARSSASSRAPA